MTHPVSAQPHIVLLIPRGEAARNFLFSDTLASLTSRCRVTVLSVVDDARFNERFEHQVDAILPLPSFAELRIVHYLRELIHEAHFRWMDTVVARNKWEMLDAEARTVRQRVRRVLQKMAVIPLAHRPLLELLTRVENVLSHSLRPTRHFDELFAQLRPDLVFNGSHIHGSASFLPVRVAKRMGIPVAGFVFSWDNLTNRSRIFEPYDEYLVWHAPMKRQLLDLYPFLRQEQVHVTGTPQFDFHFKTEFLLDREDLCARMGIDAARPFILYTTGIDRHFPEEHRHVRTVIDILQAMPRPERPQLVVRTYVKGTSAEMKALAAERHEDVVFPAVRWEERWFTPAYEDLAVYSSLIHHASMSINAASTVSLEFLMFGKPVMNIGFDPPGSSLPQHLRWHRHIEFDHYAPVAASGAVMVAMSVDDMERMIRLGMARQSADDVERRKQYMRSVFGNLLDGNSGVRVADTLHRIATDHMHR